MNFTKTFGGGIPVQGQGKLTLLPLDAGIISQTMLRCVICGKHRNGANMFAPPAQVLEQVIPTCGRCTNVSWKQLEARAIKPRFHRVSDTVVFILGRMEEEREKLRHARGEYMTCIAKAFRGEGEISEKEKSSQRRKLSPREERRKQNAGLTLPSLRENSGEVLEGLHESSVR